MGSDLPLSIIIIGIGDGSEFKEFHTLDADINPLYSQIEKRF